MCFIDVEPCEVWCPSYPVARNNHQCMECGEPIHRGTRYMRVTGIFDHSPFTHIECRRCCYDRGRLIRYELSVGCERSTADPGMGQLVDGLTESGMQLTPRLDVPGDFDVRRFVWPISTA